MAMCCALNVIYARYIAQNIYPWLEKVWIWEKTHTSQHINVIMIHHHIRNIQTHDLGIRPLCHTPVNTVIAQLHIKNTKPVCTEGINDMGRPSFDNSISFCVNNPKPKPIKRLKLGPAKLNGGSVWQTAGTYSICKTQCILTMLPYCKEKRKSKLLASSAL